FWLSWVVCRSFCFSSRRRHTRCYRDWSSDVCSSDLLRRYKRRWIVERTIGWLGNFRRLVVRYDRSLTIYQAFFHIACSMIVLRRSEERRVGKECRWRWSTDL